MFIECHMDIMSLTNVSHFVLYAIVESCINFNFDINVQAWHNKIVIQSMCWHCTFIRPFEYDPLTIKQ